MSVLATFLSALFLALAQSAPYIVIGYLIAALIRELVPMSSLIRHFGSEGVTPLLNAVGVGALLPICSCGVVPLGIGVFRGGAARGTVMAFMTAAPGISPVAVMMGYNHLGPKLTGLYIGIVLVGALILGAIANAWLSGASEAEFRAARGFQPPTEYDARDAGRRDPLTVTRAAFKWAFWDLGGEVSVDLLIGLSLAALVLAFVPETWITSMAGGQSILSLLVICAVAVPVYTCSVPSIPVVQMMLLKGLSPGAAIAFMIAGPATNLGEINAIRHQLGARSGAFYVTSVFAIALLGGTLVDNLAYPNYQYRPMRVGDELITGENCCVPVPFEGQTRPDTMEAVLANVPGWHWPAIVALGATIVAGLTRRVLEAMGRIKPPASLPSLDNAAATVEAGAEPAREAKETEP